MRLKKSSMKQGEIALGLILTLLILASCPSIGWSEDKKEEKPSINASVGILNKYVFRGYEIGTDSAVIQPSLSVSYKGFSIGFWGNIDTDENPTQNLTAPDREGKASFNEVDLTLSYTYTFDKLSLTGGYIYYGTKYAPETHELFISASYDIISKPTLTIYRDIAEYPGTYINLSFSHSLPLYNNITLDLGMAFGYFWGDGSYWKTYEASTGTYSGEKYKAFHDGMVKAGLTIPLMEHFSLQPMLQYWFPLSDKANREVDGNSYNPNGYIEGTFVVGVTFSFSW
ncbi:MAG: hypothetical protein N2260_00935 [Syntrophobacterales bacterium]|nr:hypothetical protein [Syntrophobacterales bacterium]